MNIERVIQLAGMVERGNVLPEELAIEFLSEFDGMIQSDIMLHAPEEIVHYDSKEQELLLRPPHDGLYLSFLVAMIRQCQGEFEGYNNAQEIVEDKLKTFRRWYIHHYRPADTNSRSYTGGTSGDGFGFAYLSAYGLAVKHGYQGTEEEWLQSLKGEKGDTGEAARMRYDAERDMLQWGVGDEWHDLYTMAEVLAPLYAKLDEMTGRAEEAAERAESARDEADAAAKAAQTSAGVAAESVTNAKSYSITAAQKADAAAGSADNAQTQAETAGNHAQDAQAAAEEAKKAAQEAKDAAAQGGIAEETDPTVPEWAKQSQKPSYTASEVGADPAGTASQIMAGHNAERYAHEDIRRQMQELTDLIYTVDASKVGVEDIVNDLVTSAVNKPLSAEQGRILKNLYDLLETRIGDAVRELGSKVGADELTEAVETALTEAKESGAFDGEPGEDGGHYTPVVTQPTASTMQVSFVPSKDGMPTVEPVTVELPQGSGGGGGTARWVKRAEATVTEEETRRIKFDADLDGNPLNIDKTHRWVVESGNVNYSANGYVDLQVNRNWNGGTTSSVACRVTVYTGADHLIYSVERFPTGELVIQTLCADPSAQSQRIAGRMVTEDTSYDGENISIISLLCKSGTYFNVGSTFAVWEEVFE